MKKVTLFSALLLISASCQPREDVNKFNILIENQSDSPICIEADWYPDDSLKVIAQMMDPINPGLEIGPHSKEKFYQASCGKKVSWYYLINIAESENNGYISFTIMDKEVQSCGNVEKVQTEYDVLARYDLTKDDIDYLGWRLTYPPSPELKGLHIWIKP